MQFMDDMQDNISKLESLLNQENFNQIEITKSLSRLVLLIVQFISHFPNVISKNQIDQKIQTLRNEVNVSIQILKNNMYQRVHNARDKSKRDYQSLKQNMNAKIQSVRDEIDSLAHNQNSIHSSLANLYSIKDDILEDQNIIFEAMTNFHGYSGITPLHKASENGQLSVVRAFIAHGANVNCTSLFGSTPLHLACKNGNYEIVRHLISNGADVNCSNFAGFTPLHYAAQYGSRNVVTYLLSHGADKYIKDNTRSRPYDIADKEIKDLLR